MSELDRFKGSTIPTLKFVQSSNIIGVSYKKETKTLYVLFKNKKAYEYFDVPDWEYEGLLNTKSPGSYLARRIKPQYPAKMSFVTNDYLVTDYKDCKLVITDIDEGRGYVLIDGEKHNLFDPSPTINKNGSDSIKSPEEEIR